MIYVEAPNTYEGDYYGPVIFLAGGITGCPDWQQYARGHFLQEKTKCVLVNPRRAHFPIWDPTAAKKQIAWEHRELRHADAILFWFPCETICPIVLYELGAWSMTDKDIFVGVHPDYKRRQDVEIQTKLARPEVEIVYDLSSLVKQVIDWV